MRVRVSSSGKRRISYRLGRGIWISEDADQDVSADPSWRTLCGLMLALDSAILVFGALSHFRLPFPNEDAAIAIMAGAVIAFPFLLFIDWRVNRGRKLLVHLLSGAALGALVGLLLRLRQ